MVLTATLDRNSDTIHLLSSASTLPESHLYKVSCHRFGGGGGGFGRGRGGYDDGPPSEVVEAGIMEHTCEGEVVVKLTNEKVPTSSSIYSLGRQRDGFELSMKLCIKQQA